MQRPGQLDRSSALQFLTSRIDYERTSSVPYGLRDFRLDRMRELLARLDNPHERLPIVHVAGTKGKGSTAATIAAVLTAAGYRTGLYSSPHLDRVEERMRVDGAPCPGDTLVSLVDRVRSAVEAMDANDQVLPEEGSNRPTYFEIITALALVHFVDAGVQAAVLEVGLGGRLDSTNVCQPKVSVITSISYDHTQQLGNTLAAIAGEKAGIIKPGTSVVSGVVPDEPRQVVRRVAAENGSPLVELGCDFDFSYSPPRNLEADAHLGHMDYWENVRGESLRLAGLPLQLAGRHQAANAAIGIATLSELTRQGWQLPVEAIRAGLTNVRWPARIEVVGRRPAVVLDAAHNVASIEALVTVLGESFSVRRRTLIFATTRDKDVPGMLAQLLPQFDEVIFTRYRNNPRGVPTEELQTLAAEIKPGTYHQCGDAVAAWQLARGLTGEEDLICITGSFFIAAEVRAAMGDADYNA